MSILITFSLVLYLCMNEAHMNEAYMNEAHISASYHHSLHIFHPPTYLFLKPHKPVIHMTTSVKHVAVIHHPLEEHYIVHEDASYPW